MLTEVYGMTEIAIATENPKDDRRIGSAGRASAQFELRIVDENDEPLPAGRPGRSSSGHGSPGVMIDRYFDMPEATVEAFRNLWFHTGDRGYLDEDDYLWFVDRLKDCIRRRGENISSFEVEKTLNNHPDDRRVRGLRREIGALRGRGDGRHRAPARRHARSRRTPRLVPGPRMAHFAVPRYVRVRGGAPEDTRASGFRSSSYANDGITDDTWDRDTVGYQVRR